jgi:hypothetical protein
LSSGWRPIGLRRYCPHCFPQLYVESASMVVWFSTDPEVNTLSFLIVHPLHRILGLFQFQTVQGYELPRLLEYMDGLHRRGSARTTIVRHYEFSYNVGHRCEVLRYARVYSYAECKCWKKSI